MQAEDDWSEAEQKLLDDAHTGFVFIASTRPDAATDANRIRADLIRHITLGGCDTCRIPDKGVTVRGAFITGKLDLEGCDTPLDLVLANCRFDTQPNLRDARLGAVILPGCALPGLNAHRMRVARGVILNTGFETAGPVDLSSAHIDQTVDCVGSTFDGRGKTALNMNAITIGASLFLCKGDKHDFTATGLVNLTRASVTGNVRCAGGRFEGGLAAEGLRVGAGFFWEGIGSFAGKLDLTDAHVGRLHDDKASWQGANPLILNGFRYDRLSGDMRIAERLGWLAAKQDKDQPPPPEVTGENRLARLQRRLLRQADPKAQHVDPQPYTHLARILREKGMTQGAARVLEARDERISDALFQRALRMGETSAPVSFRTAAMAYLRRLWDRFLMKPVFGYGHQPSRALKAVLVIVALNTALYFVAYRTGQMAPTSDVVLTSVDWTSHVALDDKGRLDRSFNTLKAWDRTEAAKDYTTFNAPLYALDLFIPLDALGQEAAWAPSPVRGFWGTLGFATGWLTQLSGWIITAIAAAAVAGIVGKKD